MREPVAEILLGVQYSYDLISSPRLWMILAEQYHLGNDENNNFPGYLELRWHHTNRDFVFRFFPFGYKSDVDFHQK